jgi:DNA-binding NtrC family response regulator
MDHTSRIFVVDDEPLIASTLTTILKMNGFSAECFTDPTAALKASVAWMPDLLISDVVMPQLSGIELAILMMNENPQLEVLLISGQAAHWTFWKAPGNVGTTSIYARSHSHLTSFSQSYAQRRSAAT